MNKKELIREAARTAGFTQKQMKTVVDAFIGAIVDHLEPPSGERVNIQGLGSFYFIRDEHFGTFDVTDVTTEKDKDEILLFTFRNNLRFYPDDTLRRHLKNKGWRVQFRPAKRFNTNESFPCFLPIKRR